MRRFRQELSNEYLLDEIGVDTAENEPFGVWGKIQLIIHSPPYPPPHAASEATSGSAGFPLAPLHAVSLGPSRCARKAALNRAGTDLSNSASSSMAAREATELSNSASSSMAAPAATELSNLGRK